MQPLKDLIPKLSPTLKTTSETIAAQKAVPARIGQPPGVPGLPSTSVGTAPDLGRALMQADPKRTLETVQASMPQGIRSSLKPAFNPTGTLTHYELKGEHGPQEITTARRILERSLTPISGNEALDLLTELKALTRPQAGQTTQDVAEQLKAYLKRVMPYPADVVRHVLTTQPADSPWWPAWQELQDRLEVHTYRRRMMFKALSSSARPERTILDAG